MREENKSYMFILTGSILAILTFALLLTAFGIVLGGNISFTNILSYIILSCILGVIASVYHYFRLFISFVLFIIGIIAGFLDMFRVFLVNDFGWNDVVGLMSFISYLIIGFFAGLIAQAAYFLYRKVKNKRSGPTQLK